MRRANQPGSLMGDESQFASVCRIIDATTLLSRVEDCFLGGMAPSCAVVRDTPAETEVLPVRTRLRGGELAKGDPKGEAATLAVIGS